MSLPDVCAQLPAPSSTKYSYDKLDKKTIEKLKKEINENPKQIHAHIESFRRWVKSMPHLTCPTDDHFLIKFLRYARFDHSIAQKRLDNYCTLRGSPKGICEWFPKQINPDLIKTMLDLEAMIPLGLNSENQLTLLVRPKNWDPNIQALEDLLPVIYMLIDVLVDNERIQTDGLCAIVDMDGLNQKHVKAWAKLNIVKNWARCWEEAFPIRVKQVFYYKEPVVFDIFFNMAVFFQDEKVKKRIHRIKDNFKKIHDRVPGIQQILPVEYGGHAGTIADCQERWVKEFYAYYNKENSLLSINVDESKRPPNATSYFRQWSDYHGETFETKGTYTKLSL